jgi:hypothetical protein
MQHVPFQADEIAGDAGQMEALLVTKLLHLGHIPLQPASRHLDPGRDFHSRSAAEKRRRNHDLVAKPLIRGGQEG